MMIVLTDQDLEEIVATAHMAGQQKAGVKTPTYYDAHLYYARQVKKLTISRVSQQSELLPDFLYRDKNNVIRIGYHGDSGVNEEWEEYLKKSGNCGQC